MPRVDVFGQILFGLEDFLQGLVELPFPKAGVEDAFSELYIPVHAMVRVRVLYLFLVGC